MLRALSSFLSHILEGNTPHAVQPFLFAGSIIALHKRDGGLRPIAVGLTLWWLATKVGSGHIAQLAGSTLAPLQLGFGVPSGCEAAVQAAHQYLASMPSNYVLLKINFRNAFNSLRQNRILVAEPSGLRLYRSDGKHPDGTSVVPWRQGKMLHVQILLPLFIEHLQPEIL